MRGKVIFKKRGCAVMRRITPAHAGKSMQGNQEGGRDRDHPRSCGEKTVSALLKNFRLRITPAHAGKSPVSVQCPNLRKDHPRSCGEKTKSCIWLSPMSGSPPLMRGKVCGMPFKRHYSGITPAHAGKRLLFLAVKLKCRDHPRSCGEKLAGSEKFHQ